MPRLTTQQYLVDRDWLVVLWRDKKGSSGYQLTPQQQWDLHTFYAPADELDKAAAIAHRAAAVARDLSLPQRARRAIKQLRADVEQLQTIMANIAAHHDAGKKRSGRGQRRREAPG